MTSILKDQINLKPLSSTTYSASWHLDWALGKTLIGGCVAAQIHHAAATHLSRDPALVARNQPDILNLHIEFLYPCEHYESIISVKSVRIGAATSVLELRLDQKGKTRVIAFATSTNFDKVIGPSAETAWSLEHPPPPRPDFDRILASQPDEHWLAGRLAGEVIPLTSRLIGMSPRRGYTVAGICDAWNGFVGAERMDGTYLAMMADMIPSMSDTLQRSGLYDAHAFLDKKKRWDQQHPGSHTILSNTVAEAMQSSTFNVTAVMDLRFKQRLPEDGQRWIFTRTSAKMLKDGRMNVDITLCNENMELLCEAHQLILVLEAQRKFNRAKSTL
ncbi:hypothetical protein HIM_08418 [Hirsutella minnesotensis 3608]|uniref:Thioesterase domain-containing protein n=1 Tax=Hirsutella minnesotensis 3608 TaxID=1043627 RepID=A0A0F7ZSY1_9HYPO|nr:hypothetical protein HIM_08418 [Hirsutella minnesotensis 3608]